MQSNTIRARQRYRATKDLPAPFISHMNAPFSFGGEGTLPAGECFIVCENPPGHAASASCVPVRYNALHARFAGPESRHYAGYSLSIDLEVIRRDCELVEEYSIDRHDKLAGVILGAAIGDALGLPRENLSATRASRCFGDTLRHHFLFGRGMASDDTEHTCMVAQALLAHPDDPQAFARSLAWRLRGWFLGLPAGIGFATLRAILKLWMGFPPGKSGVRSAGNGPAMRSAVIGACFLGNARRIRSFVSKAARLTHTDPKAEQGALAVALAAGYAAGVKPGELEPRSVLDHLHHYLDDGELRILLEKSAPTPPRGVSGYVYHTVPAAIHGWLQNPCDFRAAVSDVIRMGGDTDTTGSIVGALAGATLGASAIPQEWIDPLWEWPRTVEWMTHLAGNLHRQFPVGDEPEAAGPAKLFWPALPLRNLVFMAAVLLHGFRRLFPPY